jgi:dTDP-4-dehydrorhamnose 3,5-epimerase
MKVFETPLKDCYRVEAPVFGDSRGFFLEAFNQRAIKKELGIDFQVRQVNFASSSKNVLRGMHYQLAPFSQDKFVGVVSGAVLDVVVDIRKESPTFLQHYKLLIDKPGIMLLVPKGFAHGYLTLADNTIFYYSVDDFYSPEHERGILYSDPTFGIDWDFIEQPMISPKDLKQPLFQNAELNFGT